ncbi:beta-ketoacyl-ACP synthase [Treponema primitia]|uniref:beta-ketoacyl-ACP synthase n=1 Tax=Treponema primitia TaxID=88058 RepID=UPI00397FB4B6
MPKRVVVTGGGIVSVLGSGWKEVLESLRAGKNFVRVMDEWEKYQPMNTRLAAPVDFAAPDLPRKKLRGMGRVCLLALVATDQALKLAGLAEKGEAVAQTANLPDGRCGVAYGSSMGSIDSLLDFYSMLMLNTTLKMGATTYVRAMPQTCAANIEVYYGLTGRLITTNTACTSGSMAIGQAYELIQQGKQDIMIAGGAEELTAADAAVFDTLFAASTKNDTPECTPAAYDKNRDGLVVGEGAGTLILEEYEHAKNRGAAIYAELVGFGSNSDGTHITQPNRVTMGASLSLALADAGIKSDSIGYVNTHGTATKAGDIAETWATHDVFKRPIPVSTLKNYTGHTLGACGAIEAWVSINMMNHGWFCPNINLQNPDPQCAPLDYIMGDGREINTGYIMSNNFAFGGINTSLIFKKV